MVGRYCDVTMGLAAIVLSGRLEQYPGVQIIGASSGGALALLGNRLDLAWQPRHWDEAPGKSSHAARKSPMPNTAPRCTAPPSELMRRLYVDTTADGVTPIAMDLGVFGAGHVLFGTDSPPLPVALEAALETFGFLNAEDRDSILGGNATRIFALS
jgi:aminocarboxymuconate-semialdehyde decarboxylase